MTRKFGGASKLLGPGRIGAPKHTVAATIFAVAVVFPIAPVGAQKVYGPSDIGYLAAMSQANQAAYSANVLGVAKFAGRGVVFQIPGRGGGGQVNIDVGAGWVSCLATTAEDFSGIRRGDSVLVSGSVGGAMSWEAEKGTLNEIVSPPGVKWRAGYEYMPKDSITLLTGTCRVEKAR